LLSQHNPSEELERQCRAIVDELVVRYTWRLLERDQLVQRALLGLRAGVADQLVSAIIAAYCVALHAACSGAEGPQRQNQAYEELARYLHNLTCMRFGDLRPDIREDVTQSALERIFKSFSRCREPVAFLAFAAQHLLDAVRMARRQENRLVGSLERMFGETEETQKDILPDLEPEPVEQVIATERRAAVERFLQEFLAAHPRASQQVAVLHLGWLDDLDDAAIGQRLGISLSSVHAARSRIIKTIQSEPQWRTRAGQLGMLLDEL
jgi:RNA polymerase sigma factor (sigma-70 family)